MIPYGRSWATGGDWPLVARSQLEPLRDQLAASPTGLLLCGPAGIGKTQLAQALLDPQVQPVVRFACSPGGAGIPLTALNRLLESAGNLLPDSRESAQQRVRDHLAAISDGETVQVLGDDVQWLDDASAELLEALVRSGDVRLLCTTRTTRGLARPLRRLLRENLLHRVEVVAMSPEEVVVVLERLLSGPVDHALAEELVRVTGGNALFLREAVRSALAQGSITVQGGVWASEGWSLPTGIGMAELVDSELEQIEPEQREVAELIALGQPISLAEVVTALGESARPAVEALRDNGLLASEGQRAEASLRIAHPVYAERIRRRTPARRRRALHERRYADADISSMAPGDFLRWTTWAVESDLPIAPEELLRAAYSASSLGQDRFALRMAESALARLDEGALLDRVDALLLVSWQRLLVGDWRGGYAAAEQMVDLLADAQGPREDLVLRLYGAYRVRADIEQFVLDDVDAALATMDHFLETVAEGASLYDRTLGRARRLAWAGDSTEMRGLLPRLECDEPPTPDLLELVAPAINHLTWCGDSDRALAISERHWDAAEAYTSVLPWLLAEIFSATSHALLVSGRLEELEAHPRIALGQGIRRDHTLTRMGHALYLATVGRRDEAWGEMEPAMLGIEARDPSGLRTWASAMAADLAVMAGKWSAARRHFSVADAGRTGLSRGLEPDARLHLCRAAIGLDHADAIAQVEALASWAAEQGHDLVRLDALHLLALVDPERLREHLATAEPAPQPHPSTPVMGPLAAHVRAVLDGDDAAAREAEAALATYGRWSPGSRHGHLLTPREREVAGLVAAGLTSPEIADLMHVSTRTVEIHVSRVTTKLGVSSASEPHGR